MRMKKVCCKNEQKRDEKFRMFICSEILAKSL